MTTPCVHVSLRQQVRGLARQAAMDPGDGMDLWD